MPKNELKFKIKNFSFDKITKDFIFIMELDPDRYNYEECNREKIIFDNLNNSEISEKFLNNIKKYIRGFSFTYSSPELDYEFEKARMDFKVKDISINKETNEFIFTIELHPERYIWKETEKGEKYVFDKIDNINISENLIYDLVKMTKKIPFSLWQPQEIRKTSEYIESRKKIIEKNIEMGDLFKPTFEDKSEKYLESIKQEELAFVIMCLDIVGSTDLSFKYNSKIYAEIISIVSYEISEVIPKFHGHVLKYTGDGFITYFPEPSFVTKNDLAVDCSLTLLALIYTIINPIFQKNNLPKIEVRIGIESGLAHIKVIGSPNTKQQKDIIGKIVSMASKIQSQANPGEICIGETTERSLYTNWRKICKPIKNLKNWDYKNKDGSLYKIYRLKHKINYDQL